MIAKDYLLKGMSPESAEKGLRITVPPSKSLMHRHMICSALAGEPLQADDRFLSEDLAATKNGLKKMFENGRITVQGKTFDCGNSGSTLRFMMPLMALNADRTTIYGSTQLTERPLTVYLNLFEQQGMQLDYLNQDGKLPLRLTGKLRPGKFEIPGDISSQFISGLLFALPLLEGDSELIIRPRPESQCYIEMTMAVLDQYHIEITRPEKDHFLISGRQCYQACDVTEMEGDYSQAAFWLCLGAILPPFFEKGIVVTGLPHHSLQGDRCVIDILKKMGARLTEIDGGWHVYPSELHGVTIDVSDHPDLVPPLAVAAAAADGETLFIGGKRLRYKESDRIRSVVDLIRTSGGCAAEREDGLSVIGRQPMRGGMVDSVGDHRIAMAAAVLSVLCEKEIILRSPLCVKKSYPDFWEQWCAAGGMMDEL